VNYTNFLQIVLNPGNSWVFKPQVGAVVIAPSFRAIRKLEKMKTLHVRSLILYRLLLPLCRTTTCHSYDAHLPQEVGALAKASAGAHHMNSISIHRFQPPEPGAFLYFVSALYQDIRCASAYTFPKFS
jgi:hypothetical protein